MTPTRLLAGAAALAALSGCAEQGYAVIATTATNIGLEISQHPATNAPQFKLGYNRAEYALVPSNRPSNERTPADGRPAGAAETADALMELRYGGGAGTQIDTSIYQRLAVGETAVRQPGATLLFARRPDGDVSAGAAQFAAAAESAIATKRTSEQAVLACMIRPDGSVDAARRSALIAQAQADTPGLSRSVFLDLEDARAGPDALRAMRDMTRNAFGALAAAANDC